MDLEVQELHLETTGEVTREQLEEAFGEVEEFQYVVKDRDNKGASRIFHTRPEESEDIPEEDWVTGYNFRIEGVPASHVNRGDSVDYYLEEGDAVVKGSNTVISGDVDYEKVVDIIEERTPLECYVGKNRYRAYLDEPVFDERELQDSQPHNYPVYFQSKEETGNEESFRITDDDPREIFYFTNKSYNKRGAEDRIKKVVEDLEKDEHFPPELNQYLVYLDNDFDEKRFNKPNDTIPYTTSILVIDRNAEFFDMSKKDNVGVVFSKRGETKVGAISPNSFSEAEESLESLVKELELKDYSNLDEDDLVHVSRRRSYHHMG